MSAKVFSACMLAGLALVTTGAALRFSIPIGLMVCGTGVIVLTLVTLKVAGRS